MADLSKQLAILESMLSDIKKEITAQTAAQTSVVANIAALPEDPAAIVKRLVELEQKFAAELQETINKNELPYDREFQDILHISGNNYYKAHRNLSLGIVENCKEETLPTAAHTETLKLCKKYSDVCIILVPGKIHLESTNENIYHYKIAAKALTYAEFIESDQAKFAKSCVFNFGIKDDNDKNSIMELYKNAPNIYTPNSQKWRRIMAAKELIDLAKKN